MSCWVARLIFLTARKFSRINFPAARAACTAQVSAGAVETVFIACDMGRDVTNLFRQSNSQRLGVGRRVLGVLPKRSERGCVRRTSRSASEIDLCPSAAQRNEGTLRLAFQAQSRSAATARVWATRPPHRAAEVGRQIRSGGGLRTASPTTIQGRRSAVAEDHSRR